MLEQHGNVVKLPLPFVHIYAKNSMCIVRTEQKRVESQILLKTKPRARNTIEIHRSCQRENAVWQETESESISDLNNRSCHTNKCRFRWTRTSSLSQFSFCIFSPLIHTQITAGWICCMPCVWLRTSATVRKIALTTATLLVTSLLVASPVLFLLSTAPSQLPKDCNTKSDVNCVSTRSVSTTPECNAPACRQATISILARSNWKVDPCRDFTSFSCGATKGNVKAIKSVQEGVDILMQRK